MIKKIKNLNLRTIANSGQCVRMHENENDLFTVLSKDKVIDIKAINKDTFDFDCDKKTFDDYYYDYFDLGTNYEKFAKVCKKNDTFLKKCISFSNGLRILRQDEFETIISFIISQRKSVKAIQTSIERLSKLCGKKLKYNNKTYYAFPTSKAMAALSTSELHSCGLGYRAEYISNFCKNYNKGLHDLQELHSLTDEALIDYLISIKGVGIKVASCVALFAYHRMSICPVDIWIKRVLDGKYNGKIPDEYIKYAGIIQQYWFNYTRINKL